jgi:hypothetical protein
MDDPRGHVGFIRVAITRLTRKTLIETVRFQYQKRTLICWVISIKD